MYMTYWKTQFTGRQWDGTCNKAETGGSPILHLLHYAVQPGGLWVGWRWLSLVWKAVLVEVGFCCLCTQRLRGIILVRWRSSGDWKVLTFCLFVRFFWPYCPLPNHTHFCPLFFLSLLCFPLFFWFTDSFHPPCFPFLGNCFYFPFCASVGNSAFPVILLVGWLSVDFVQTVGSALREGLVLDLQSLLIILSSFKQPIDNRLAPSATPATHKAIYWDIVVGFYGEGSLPLLCGLIVLERDLFLVLFFWRKLVFPFNPP